MLRLQPDNPTKIIFEKLKKGLQDNLAGDQPKLDVLAAITPHQASQACLDAANGYLTTNGIIIDDQNRRTMARALGAAIQRASLNLAKLARGEGEGSPEPHAIRFPEWPARAEQAKNDAKSVASDDSLSALVEHWWKEAKAAGRKQSTYESYRNTVAKLVGFLKHDQASRVTPQDIVRYKDHRLQGGASAKTVKDSDLAGLKTVFGWAVMNRRLASNPAEGLTIKVGKSRKLRSKGFYDQEASAILKHARSRAAGREAPKLAAAKRWVPWLCAFPLTARSGRERRPGRAIPVAVDRPFQRVGFRQLRWMRHAFKRSAILRPELRHVVIGLEANARSVTPDGRTRRARHGAFLHDAGAAVGA